jgi:hypothetical protein
MPKKKPVETRPEWRITAHKFWNSNTQDYMVTFWICRLGQVKSGRRTVTEYTQAVPRTTIYLTAYTHLRKVFEMTSTEFIETVDPAEPRVRRRPSASEGRGPRSSAASRRRAASRRSPSG